FDESSNAARRILLRPSFPLLRLPLARLELTVAECPRPPLFRRGAGNMGDAFEPQPALRAEHLEAEARTGRRHGTEIAGHALFHAKEDRRRIVGVDGRGAAKT